MIAVACDHVGILLKEAITDLLEDMRLEYRFYGTYSSDRTDYQIYGFRAAQAVASGECDRGIIMCGTGVGISLAANKVKGIRCVVCTDPYSAVLSRNHNDTNMLALGAFLLGREYAQQIARSWLSAGFDGGRHELCLEMLREIENHQTLKEAE